MVYNSGPEGIMYVRMAAGNVLPEDCPDEDIEKEINSAYSKIQVGIRRNIDDPMIEGTDVGYWMCLQIERSLAAMYCLKGYGPEFRDKVDELKIETDEDIKFLQESLGINLETPTVTDEELEEGTIESTDPQGWVVSCNDSAIPNRMKPTCGKDSNLEGVGQARLDPNLDWT